MATLIGNGSHGHDIWATLPRSEAWDWMPHHEYIVAGYQEPPFIIGINDPQLRAKVAAELDVVDIAWVHPHARIAASDWGFGTHINYGVTMTRTTIGHHCTISPGVTICGDVTIGDRVLVGAGATICDRVTIGNDVTIGAGAVVLPETVIPDGETWLGVPAKPKGLEFRVGDASTQAGLRRGW